MTTLCTHCGFNNPPGMRFCGNCGTRLAVTAFPGDKARGTGELVSEQLGVTMGADLLDRFHKAGLEAAGQRRNVTVLFTDLSGYTELSGRIDAEDVYELIQQYIRLLINEVYKYEGIVDKLTGDGLMALFGAPITHENNAERAVRAALDMQTSIAKWSRQVKDRKGIELQMRVGLHAGSVIVGSIGSNLMMDYTAIGDTVNLANRIEVAAAPGTILVSEEVYGQTKVLFDFKPIPDLILKGIPRPITCYRVTGLKTSPGSVRGVEGLRAPMIGRDEELNRLKEAVNTLTERKQGGFVLVTGEAGIGKSRLKLELIRLVSPSDVRILEGQSLTYRRSVSYWLFLDLLRNYLDVKSETPETEVSHKLIRVASRTLGKRAAGLLPYLEHLLSLKPSDPSASERVRYLEAGQLRQQIFMAVRDLLVAETHSTPLLLILEDLHWADEASLDLLRFLLDITRQTPLLIFAISRPYEDGTLAKHVEWASKYMDDHFIDIRLRSLSPDQSEHLLFELLSIPEFPETLREQILQRAAGVPFYLEEILRTLIDGGVIQRDDGRWSVVPGVDTKTLGVPDTLQGLILARFDRLAKFPRRALQLASVIGHQFNLQLLEALLYPTDDVQVQEALSLLVEREYILPSNDEHVEYAFRHVLMSDAIYSTLLKRERSKIHGQVGEAIEILYADRLDEQIELLARHFSWSSRLDRALHYSIQAGQKAADRHVNEQVRQHFNQSLDLLPKVEHTPDQALQVYKGLGDVSVFTGEYPDARQYYQAALSSLENAIPGSYDKQCSGLQRKIATTFERQGEYDEALQHLAEAERNLEAVDSPTQVERGQIYSDKGWIQFRRGNLNEAEQLLTGALALLEGTSRYDVIASVYNRLGGLSFQKDDLDQATNYVRKSLVIREEMGDTVAVARSYNNLGLLGWRRGDWDRALENFTRSVELHATLGDVEGTIQLHTNIGLLLTDKGELDEAKEHLEQSLFDALQIGHSFMEALANHHLSRFWLASQEWEKSLEFSDRALNVFSEIGAEENLIDLYASIGEAWLGLNDLENAKQAGGEALKLLKENDSPPETPLAEQGRVLRLLGNIALKQEDLDDANKLLKESLDHFTKLGNQLELGRTLVPLALLARSRDDRTAFRLRLKEARMIFHQLGAKLDLKKVDTIDE